MVPGFINARSTANANSNAKICNSPVAKRKKARFVGSNYSRFHIHTSDREFHGFPTVYVVNSGHLGKKSYRRLKMTEI